MPNSSLVAPGTAVAAVVSAAATAATISATTSTAAISTAAAAVSTTAALTLCAFAGFIHDQRPTATILAVQTVDRRPHVGLVGHLHEAEAARAAGVSIHDHFR